MTGDRVSVFQFAVPVARMEDLPALATIVGRACDAGDAPPAVHADLRLAVEEAFTNIVRHGYAGRAPGPVTIELRAAPGELVVRLEDEARTFDPASVDTPALAADWSEREIGGLGWHLIGKLMDEVHHAPRHPAGNTLTLVKRWTVASSD